MSIVAGLAQWTCTVLGLSTAITEPLADTLVVLMALVTISFILSHFTKSHSWPDRFWSLAPPVYACIFASSSDDIRVRAMACLICMWGVRLTLNFHRKGGYSPSAEDYRWAYVKQWFGGREWAWQLFNLVFIAFYNCFIVWIIVLPMHVALDSSRPWCWWDTALALSFIGLLLLETIADNQQWAFQQGKQQHRRRAPYSDGFLSQGLWAYSRHPNFFAEQSMWVVIYLFSNVALSGSALDGWNGSALGAVLLISLFHASTWLTERISSEKYPKYAEYQARVSRFVPLPPKERSESPKRKAGLFRRKQQ